MPEIINTARHIKDNARKAKSFSNKVTKRVQMKTKLHSLPSSSKAIIPAARNSSTAAVVKTPTSLITGVSTKTISKKKLRKSARNLSYLNKNASSVLASLPKKSSTKESVQRKQVLMAAVAKHYELENKASQGLLEAGDDMVIDELSATQAKARARREANLKHKKEAEIMAQMLLSSSAAPELEDEMDLMGASGQGNGTILGKPMFA